jgi:hypothetical protein
MNLSPTVRWLLTGLIGCATAAVTILADGFQPLDVLLIVIALGAALGLTPPQAGGVQQSITNPRVVDTLEEKFEQDKAQNVTAPGANMLGFYWPVAVVFAARGSDINEDEALFWLGVVLVVGFLVAAGVMIFRLQAYIAAACLAALALLSAILLL